MNKIEENIYVDFNIEKCFRNSLQDTNDLKCCKNILDQSWMNLKIVCCNIIYWILNMKIALLLFIWVFYVFIKFFLFLFLLIIIITFEILCTVL